MTLSLCERVFRGIRVCFVPVWNSHWSAAATVTGGCCGTAGPWWHRTPHRGSRGRWGCGWCRCAPGSGWSWASQFLLGGPLETHWRSPGPPWFLSWLKWQTAQMRRKKNEEENQEKRNQQGDNRNYRFCSTKLSLVQLLIQLGSLTALLNGVK